MTINRYKLVSGMWFRWEGDKATGGRKKYTTKEGENVVENVTVAEITAMGAKLELVAGTSAVEVPAIVAVAPTTPVVPAKVVAVVPDEIVGDIETVNEPEVEIEEDLATWSEVVAGNLKDVVASVKVIEDVDDLKAIRTAEKNGMNRMGVLAAIKKRELTLKAGG